MQVGDLVKVIENDMSKIIPVQGLKNTRFFNQIGMIIDRPRLSSGRKIGDRWIVQFPSGIYQACEDAIEVITKKNKLPASPSALDVKEIYIRERIIEREGKDRETQVTTSSI